MVLSFALGNINYDYLDIKVKYLVDFERLQNTISLTSPGGFL